MTLAQKITWRIKNIYFKKINTAYSTLKDRIIIPPYTEKRRIILGYKKKFGPEIFIESGTFFGDTVEQFKNDFKKLLSFELGIDLAEKARQRFLHQTNVMIIYGDSGKLLPAYLKDITAPCLFWLDGHYSSEFFTGGEYIVTAKGDKNTPIIDELTAILNHPVKRHVILIDDARCFTGNNDYPSIKELKKIIASLNKDLSVSVRRDIIRITPHGIRGAGQQPRVL